MITIENYIGGEMVNPASGSYLDNIDPATGDVYSQTPDSDDRDVNLAADAARAAFPKWSMMSPEARFEILMRLVSFIERDLEDLARAESIDNGKPLSLARVMDIPRAASNFRFYATAAMHTANESHETVGQALAEVREQLGICSLALDGAIQALQIDAGQMIGRLRRTELIQLGRTIHRLWRQSVAPTPEESQRV